MENCATIFSTVSLRRYCHCRTFPNYFFFSIVCCFLFLGIFGDIAYSLVGDQSKNFNIDAETGVITVQNSTFLDRERQTEISFSVMASDKAPVTTRRSTVVPVSEIICSLNPVSPF